MENFIFHTVVWLFSEYAPNTQLNLNAWKHAMDTIRTDYAELI